MYDVKQHNSNSSTSHKATTTTYMENETTDNAETFVKRTMYSSSSYQKVLHKKNQVKSGLVFKNVYFATMLLQRYGSIVVVKLKSAKISKVFGLWLETAIFYNCNKGLRLDNHNFCMNPATEGYVTEVFVTSVPGV